MQSEHENAGLAGGADLATGLQFTNHEPEHEVAGVAHELEPAHPPIPPLPPLVPPAVSRDHHGLVAHLKEWVRREIALAHEHGLGHDERTRLNP